MAQEGLHRGPDFKVWLMAEIPANIILADQFNQFVDGYSIGSNDLTMLVMGCDRDNDTVAPLFDERTWLSNGLSAISSRLLTKTARPFPSAARHRASIRLRRISGQERPSIPSRSTPTAVVSTRKHVAQVEQRILLDSLTGKGRADTEDYTW